MTGLQRLEKKLSETLEWSEHQAWVYERNNTICWWLTVFFTGTASTIGFLLQVDPVRNLGLIKDSGWLVSLITATGAGVEALRRTSRWRQLSKVTWRLNSDVLRITSLLLYEMNDKSEVEKVSLGAVMFTEAQKRFGSARDTILDEREVTSKQGQSSDDRLLEIKS